MLGKRPWPRKIGLPYLPARGCSLSACAKCGVRPAELLNGVRSAKPADNAGVGSGAPSRTNRG